MSKNAVRVIDLFHEWDDDGSGSISKKEFCKALPALGLECPMSEIESLFDSWDPDGSGAIELAELNKQLRRGGEIELDASLQPGAAGEIVLECTNKVALRKDKIDKSSSTLFQGLDLEEDSDKSVAEQVHAPGHSPGRMPPRLIAATHSPALATRPCLMFSCLLRSCATRCRRRRCV